MSEMSALKRLAKTHPDLEVWWDSSPLSYDDWLEGLLAKQKENPWIREDELIDFFGGPAPDRFIRGVTTNPPLCGQVLENDPEHWRGLVRELSAARPDFTSEDILWATYNEIVRLGAEMMLPVFEATNGKQGFLSGQVDPRQLIDTDKMVFQGRLLSGFAPNIMIKMPATEQGIEGIRRLTALGISTNATLSFTVSQAIAVAEAVKTGLEEARKNRIDLSRWRSVCTLMLGRLEDCPVFHRQAEEQHVHLTEADLRWVGIGVFKKAQKIFVERGYPTKLLAASMRPGPTIDGVPQVWHVAMLAGLPVVLTIFPNIIEQFLESYDVAPIMSDCRPADMPDLLLQKLRKVQYFRESYDRDGLKPHEFELYPAVVETTSQFTQATTNMKLWVEEAMSKT